MSHEGSSPFLFFRTYYNISHRNRPCDVRMRIVILQREILVFEREDILLFGIDTHGRQRTGISGELQFHLFQVVVVDMRVAQSVDEIARFETRHLRHHLKQQGI